MLSKLSFILTCCALALSFSMNAQASPISSVQPQPAPALLTPVRDGCGWGFHLAPCGCIRNYTACPVIVVPSAPVVVVPHVVVPHYVPPVVARPVVCPYGYYLSQYGTCVPY
jgi:hypothetical protein